MSRISSRLKSGVSLAALSTRRQALGLIGAGAAAATLPLSASAAPTSAKGSAARPNVVVIVLDDTGFADLGPFGSEIKTPNIDALAMGGLRYNRFDTRAICSATRAALLTGRNSQTVHMEDLPPAGKAPATPIGVGPCNFGELPTNAETLAQAMRAAGYSTFALGKWHLCPMFVDAPARNMASWPLQRGFDYFRGFLSGHTNQYHPDLVENNTVLPTPDAPDYHLSVDLVDHAIALMQPGGETEKFLYLAFGAAHTPYHVPKSYIDAYTGIYDKGWDALREERFARQKKMGVIPENTILPPRENGDAAWDSLDDQRKRVFARFMETYAGFLTHTDEQIGRLIDHLKQTGQFDNTLIVLITDNGAASEGGPDGAWLHPYSPNRETVAQMDAQLDQAGSPSTYMLYQRPWAMAGDTPLRRYKLWPFLGGVRTPLIVSWPKHVKDGGAIRTQYVDLVDIAPTVLDAAGGRFAATIDGVAQIPIAGQSFLSTLGDAAAKTRSVQFFELRGNRAITRDNWRAVAMHKFDTDFADDPWQLFDVGADFSESTDLSRKYPQKLEELKALWWTEARRYSDPPVVKPLKFLYDFNHIADAFD